MSHLFKSIIIFFSLFANIALANDQVEILKAMRDFKSGNYAPAIRTFLKYSKQGSTHADLYIGIALANGWGVVEDDKKAVTYLKIATQANLSEAWLNLGYIYRNGGNNVKTDFKRAYAHFAKAAKLDNLDAYIQLASMNASSQGVVRNNKLVMQYYIYAAQKGKITAMRSLGFNYRRGVSTQQNYKQAIYWYKKAAILQNHFALAELADMYERGEGFRLSYINALAYYMLAEKLGNIGAMQHARDLKLVMSVPDRIAANNKALEIVKLQSDENQRRISIFNEKLRKRK